MKFNKVTRIVILIAAGILIIVSSYTFITELSVKKYEDKTITQFSANNKAEISNEVYLKPNSLYRQRILDKEKMIITEFVDYISAQCQYQYHSEQKADITGSYELLADVECYTSEQDTQTTIWKQTIVLQPEISFEESQSQEVSISERVDISLTQYNEFVKKVSEESKINANTKLTVYMNFKIKAVTESGVVEESLAPNMVIPLNVSYFNMGGNPKEEKPITIENTTQILVPVNYAKVYALIAADIILILALIYVLIFTKGVEPDPYERLLKRIFNKHGDRMVALRSEIDETLEYKYEVNSIEDLVRISDEVEKPIIYRYNDEKNNINKFYVVHEREIYFWCIDEPNIDDNEEVEMSKTTSKLIGSINNME